MSKKAFLSHTSELAKFPKARPFMDAVLDAVRQACWLGVDMRDFTAESRSPTVVDAEQLRGCDAYIGVLGLRYGTPARDRPERSYTEMEYDAAVEAETFGSGARTGTT